MRRRPHPPLLPYLINGDGVHISMGIKTLHIPIPVVDNPCGYPFKWVFFTILNCVLGAFVLEGFYGKVPITVAKERGGGSTAANGERCLS